MNTRNLIARLEKLEWARRPREERMHWHSPINMAAVCKILAEAMTRNHKGQDERDGKVFQFHGTDCDEGVTFGQVLRGERPKVCKKCNEAQEGFGKGPEWRCGAPGCGGVHSPEKVAEYWRTQHTLTARSEHT